MQFGDFAQARTNFVRRQGLEVVVSQTNPMRRVKGPDLVFVGLDVDGAFAADATVALRQEGCGNQFPAQATKEHGGDEAADVLQNAAADNDEAAVAAKAVLEQPEKNRGQTLEGLLLLGGFDFEQALGWKR